MAKAPVQTTAPARPAPQIRTAPLPPGGLKAPETGKVEPIDPDQQGPGEAEAEQGSQVQNAPTDEEAAAALLTPEGQAAAAQAAEAANAEAAKAAAKITEKIVANAKIEPLTPANAFADEPTATMISPREFYVLLQDGRRVQFKKGTQEVCESLQNHSYVKAHGVELYAK